VKVPLFLPDESPYLIELKIATTQVLHLGIKQHCATFSDFDAEPHDGIAVNARNPLNRANARTFCQCSDYRDLLVGIE
jgi:hypothetical protein